MCSADFVSLVLPVYVKRTAKAGIAAGILIGALVLMIRKLFFKASADTYELSPAIIASLATVLMAGMLTAARNEDCAAPVAG